jgi:TetR/AcrR family transcriptional regulator, mexCD-oprJ operon repressor
VSEDPQRSNERLLELAMGVLSADPNLSMLELAQAVGVSRATLHRRFPSRDALLAAIAEIAIGELGRATQEITARRLTGRAALEALLDEMVTLAPRFGFIASEKSLDKDPHILASIEAIFEQWERWCVDGQRAGELRVEFPARWIVAAMDGLVISAYDRLIRLTLFGGIAEESAPPNPLRSSALLARSS